MAAITIHSSVKLFAMQLLAETQHVEENDSDLIAVIIAVLATLPDEELDDIKPSAHEALSVYSLDDFRFHFGMQRSTFDTLYAIYERTRPVQRNEAERVKHLLSTFWYCANQESLQGIANRFEISESNVFVLIRQVTAWMKTVVEKIFLRWPKGKRAIEVQDAFKKQAAIPGIMGVVGSLHIRIKSPSEDHCYFKDSHGNHSIILQGVVLPNYLFSNVFCELNGSEDNATVFENSPLHEIIRRDPDSLFPPNTRLIAGLTYPKCRWIASPYGDREYLTREEIAFNRRHGKLQATSSKAFEMLTQRFPRLQLVDMKSSECVAELTVMCCTLHNICCLTEDELEWLIKHNLDDVKFRYQSGELKAR